MILVSVTFRKNPQVAEVEVIRESIAIHPGEIALIEIAKNKFRHAFPKGVAASVRSRGAVSSALNNIHKMLKGKPPLPFGNGVRVVVHNSLHAVFVDRFSSKLFAPVLTYPAVDLLRAVQDAIIREDTGETNSSLRVGEFLAEIVTKVRRRTFILGSTVVQCISVLKIQEAEIIIMFFESTNVLLMASNKHLLDFHISRQAFLEQSFVL